MNTKEVAVMLFGVIGFPIFGLICFGDEPSISNWVLVPICAVVGFFASMMTIGNLNSSNSGSTNARNQSNAYMAASVLQRQQMKKELDEVNQKLDDIDDSFGG